MSVQQLLSYLRRRLAAIESRIDYIRGDNSDFAKGQIYELVIDLNVLRGLVADLEREGVQG